MQTKTKSKNISLSLTVQGYMQGAAYGVLLFKIAEWSAHFFSFGLYTNIVGRT